MSTITLEVTITCDDEAWAGEFGVSAAEVSADMRAYLTSAEALEAVSVAVAGITGAPIEVTTVHAPDLIGELYNAAGSDQEVDTLDELQVRAGFKWRCEAPTERGPEGFNHERPCGLPNGMDDAACQYCGAARPAAVKA